MAGGKEIRTKISSIRNTQKITKAMEMVSASKMRKAQDRMTLGKPYAHRIRSVIGHIANATPEYRHIYFDTRDVKRVGYIVVSTDRGLCGGLNINAFKATVASMKEWNDKWRHLKCFGTEQFKNATTGAGIEPSLFSIALMGCRVHCWGLIAGCWMDLKHNPEHQAPPRAHLNGSFECRRRRAATSGEADCTARRRPRTAG